MTAITNEIAVSPAQSSQMQKASALKASAGTLETKDQIREVAGKFAGFFVGQIMKEMRSDIDYESLGFGGSSERWFQEMADDAMGEEIGQGDAYGLTDLIYKSMIGRQQVAADRLAAARAAAAEQAAAKDAAGQATASQEAASTQEG